MMYEDACRLVAKGLGLPETLVKKAYRAYWKAVREHIKSLPLKNDLTDEEFSKLKPNVNIPSIGKLYVTLDRYKRMKKNFKILEELKEKKNATHKED